jgi:hypothetical protein
MLREGRSRWLPNGPLPPVPPNLPAAWNRSRERGPTQTCLSMCRPLCLVPVPEDPTFPTWNRFFALTLFSAPRYAVPAPLIRRLFGPRESLLTETPWRAIISTLGRRRQPTIVLSDTLSEIPIFSLDYPPALPSFITLSLTNPKTGLLQSCWVTKTH